jgi:hypothetical protein
LALAPGCGSDSLGPATTPLSEGVQVSPQRYLADTDAAAAAVARFTESLEAVGAVATRPSLAQAAPGLRAALDDAEAAAQRLEAERLEDARLEAQRARAAEALEQVLAAMRLATAAAAAGQPQRFVAAVDDYSNAVAGLRAEPAMP